MKFQTALSERTVCFRIKFKKLDVYLALCVLCFVIGITFLIAPIFLIFHFQKSYAWFILAIPGLLLYLIAHSGPYVMWDLVHQVIGVKEDKS